MNYTLECLEKFEELDFELKEIFGGDKANSLIEELESQFEVDLAFVLILLAINELYISDLAEYLKKKYNLAPEKANLIVKEIEENIVKTADEYILERQEEKTVENINFQEIILSVFSENLLLLFSYAKEDVRNFNIATFAAFNEFDMLEEKVFNALYNNQELISKEKIIIDGKQKKASIANFLKDFIKTHGSDMPDNLILANYLNSSSNVKKLKETEKNILNRVLKTYRNLIFFPDSMEGVPMEFWEIIPVRGNNEEVLDVLEDKKETKKINEDLKKKILENKEIKEKKVLKPIKKEELVDLKDIKEKSLSELKELMKEYPSGSLGYKAIKQELNRLQNNKKK